MNVAPEYLGQEQNKQRPFLIKMQQQNIKIKHKEKTDKEKEQISYYFNQYWAFYNPMMLRMGELTDKMEEIFAEEWRKIE